MTDYISREAAKNILKRHEHRFTCADEANGYGNVKWSEYVIYSETAQNCIDALPAADARPVVQGKWVDEPIKSVRYHCSVCQGRFDYTWHFCPNCGADMREEI